MRRVPWVDGACVLVRAAALDDTGLLAERYFHYQQPGLLARDASHTYSTAGQGPGGHDGAVQRPARGVVAPACGQERVRRLPSARGRDYDTAAALRSLATAQ